MTDTSYAPTPSTVTTTVDAPATMPSATGRSLSIVSLVLSGVALVAGLGILGAGGIVTGFIARRDEPAHRTLSTWGIVLGFVALFGWVVLAIVGVAALMPFWLAGALGN